MYIRDHLQWCGMWLCMLMDTGNMISVPVSLDRYSTRICSRTCAGISIQVIHMYLDTYEYSREPMDFFNFFFTNK